MTVMIADLLKRIPALSVIPLLVWTLGMTVYVVAWKTQIDYRLEGVVAASAQITQQSERVVAIEQNIRYLHADVQQIKNIFLSKKETNQ